MVFPPYVYKIEHNNNSVLISGDTEVSEDVISLAENVDLFSP